MKAFIKYNLLPIFVIIIVSTLSYGAVSDYNKNSINSIKAIVDDAIITQEDVVKRAAIAIKEAQDRYGDAELMEKIDQILKDTLEEIINRKVLIKEANKLFGTNEAMMKEVDKDLNSFVKGAVKNVGSLSKYYEIAEAQGINPIEKKNELKEDIMIDKIMKENVHDKVKVPPKLLRRYYCENIDEFRQKKEVKLRHLMVKFSAHNNNKEETLSITQKIMKRIEKGEDFSSVAKQCSDGPNTDNGGLCSFEEVNELRKDLRDVVYSLKDNAYSKIVESPVGYHIFKVELIKPEKIQEFEEVQDDIYKKLLREETSRLKRQYINSLKQKVFIKVIN
ncbi:MAG: peptidylprolyl isomerase [Candidatus Brocadiales bacterium]|uniref:peptidylprolyl isomerase n=1 Tax=Candidatus Wunengus sp. YC60 TaxID=3367697 RepID=UPI0027141EE6|nr:peptidylprolyl isomerase [Candidatus Brocadiales bacterium]